MPWFSGSGGSATSTAECPGIVLHPTVPRFAAISLFLRCFGCVCSGAAQPDLPLVRESAAAAGHPQRHGPGGPQPAAGLLHLPLQGQQAAMVSAPGEAAQAIPSLCLCIAQPGAAAPHPHQNPRAKLLFCAGSWAATSRTPSSPQLRGTKL